ncbi:MAG: hypothetical protein AAF744_06900 [Pseudomonadota bacterium]
MTHPSLGVTALSNFRLNSTPTPIKGPVRATLSPELGSLLPQFTWTACARGSLARSFVMIDTVGRAR